MLVALVLDAHQFGSWLAHQVPERWTNVHAWAHPCRSWTVAIDVFGSLGGPGTLMCMQRSHIAWERSGVTLYYSATGKAS